MSEICAGLVSVVIPVYNRTDMVADAVNSALTQTHKRIEVLVVDDGSSDGTADVVSCLCDWNPGKVRLLAQPNRGPGAARNLGLRHARGEFVQYLDSDDLLEPRKFELQVAALRAHPEAGVAYGLTRRLDLATGESRNWARTGEDIVDIFPSFLMQRGWDTNSPLWRRSALERIGPWQELCCMEDWEHDLRAGLDGVVPVRVREHVATVRDHGETRASGMASGFTVNRVRDIFLAHRSIWQRMRELDRHDWSYLEPLSRKMFWISRLCGERGLLAEADEALAIAEAMAGTHRVSREMRVFRALRRVVGWRGAVVMAETARRTFGRGGR